MNNPLAARPKPAAASTAPKTTTDITKPPGLAESKSKPTEDAKEDEEESKEETKSGEDSSDGSDDAEETQAVKAKPAAAPQKLPVGGGDDSDDSDDDLGGWNMWSSTQIN